MNAAPSTHIHIKYTYIIHIYIGHNYNICIYNRNNIHGYENYFYLSQVYLHFMYLYIHIYAMYFI